MCLLTRPNLLLSLVEILEDNFNAWTKHKNIYTKTSEGWYRHEEKYIQYFQFPFPSVQFSSVGQSCPTLCNPMNCSMPGLLFVTISRSSLRLTSIKLVMPSSHLILCCPLLLLPPIPPGIRVFSNESTLRMRWPKYWNFSFSIIPSKEIPELISFRMDWLDILAVQGTLKSLLQHHSSKASILWHSTS